MTPRFVCAPNRFLHKSIANNPRIRRGSSTLRGCSVLFLAKCGDRGARTELAALVSSGPWIVSCVSRELRAGLGHVSWELLAGRGRARRCKSQFLPCSDRRFFIDPRRSIDMDNISDLILLLNFHARFLQIAPQRIRFIYSFWWRRFKLSESRSSKFR